MIKNIFAAIGLIASIAIGAHSFGQMGTVPTERCAREKYFYKTYPAGTVITLSVTGFSPETKTVSVGKIGKVHINAIYCEDNE